MKTLTEHINTVSEQKLTKLIGHIGDIPNSATEGDYELGKLQERYIVKKLNIYYPEYTWTTTEDYYKEKYNHKIDLEEGDIIGLKKDIPNFFIDLKVSSLNTSLDMVGVIKLNSILKFKNDNKHYYLCINKDGSKFITKKSSEIKDIFNDKSRKCLLTTKNLNERDKGIKPELNQYLDKYIKNSFKNVSEKDFMPSFIFNN